MENIMPTVFVTGANRGLGFEHVKQYAKKNWEIIATSRNPEKSTELLQLRDQYPDNLIIEKLDVTNFEEIAALSDKYADKPIDILINNAGTLGPKGVPEAMGYQNIGHMDYEIWRDILEVNLLTLNNLKLRFKVKI